MRILIACLSLCLSVVSTAQEWQSTLLVDHPLVGKIVEVESGDSLTRESLNSRLASSPYVLIGEKHDNPDHHLIEQHLLNTFAASDTAVVFEMLNDTQAPLIDSLKPNASLDDFKQQLQWPGKGWAWQDYGPLFQTVVQQGAALLAGNIDRQTISQLYSGGVDVLTDKQRFETVTAVSEKTTDSITELVFESHCKMMPREYLQPMVNIQLAKDASMASAMVRSAKSQKLLIAGNVHTRKDVGVPQHLAVKGIASATVAIIEVQESLQQVTDYPEVQRKQADYVWFTPKVTDKDYCEDLKGRAKK